MKEFKSKVAVVIGAASGIGRAVAERCVREGMKVVLADIDDANLARTEAELKHLGETVLGVRTDVSKRTEGEQLARRTPDAFGIVHLLVNNAGVGADGSGCEPTACCGWRIPRIPHKSLCGSFNPPIDGGWRTPPHSYCSCSSPVGKIEVAAIRVA